MPAALVSESEDWLDSSSGRPIMAQGTAVPAARRQHLPATSRLHSVLESAGMLDAVALVASMRDES